MNQREQWVKASASADSGNCVEMLAGDGQVRLRDSKQGERGAVLRLAPGGFAVWIEGAKAGQFDQLI
ncbi:hypothetical protein GCM10022223_69910 [Kineosporia mesophila]|uniref:DUF397 domain-containing protein n=1 Tax=Kineosporia mesophila TaxID=566012 RepID=A0ABP7AU45_9ACTN|nr:DUF397 domain-containing protein [Kineosporia mesophila]MCD5355126.1 DUF397 domain-containing protein [Kineosporia mesophila]